ncbi:MAG: SDR family oxidoreductase [Candidatus Aminicenantes bacterium]|nr:MAG: SDR family oxidoreductase [Candidatus Aminicenantes bacterium]RPJ02923.1 MAG: SDR family oxidoreductase [Candidatus Aminicenantes bacterium]
MTKIILVTGATGGLGRVVVKRLLGSGAVVAAVHRDEAKFRDLVAFTGAAEESLSGFRADVTSEPEVREMVEAVVRRHGRIDALLNLAGTYRGGKDIAETAEDDWDFLMRTNLKSAFLCSRAVLPGMTRAGSGRIVNVAARPAVEKKGRARSGAYAVSKAGVVVLTDVIAEETRKSGITAHCVVPGTIDTPDNRAAMPDGDFSKWADPADIAEVVLFLVSEAASVTSGAVIPVYGKS